MTGTGANPPVDASGRLPDGRTFKDATEFKKLLADQPEPFVHAFTEKLATYAMRRAMTVDDAAGIEAVVAKSRDANYGLKTLIENFISSDLFLKR